MSSPALARDIQRLRRHLDPAATSEAVARVCATFIWDQDEARYLRVGGCQRRHDHLKKVQFDIVDRGGDQILVMTGRDDDEDAEELQSEFAFDSIRDLFDGLLLLKEFERSEFMQFDGFFDGDMGALHLDLHIFKALCDDESPSYCHSRNKTLRHLAGFVLPGGGSNVDLRSDCEADISAFLDSIKPPLVAEHGPVEGLQSHLMPFQARAVAWALGRERTPETPSSKLDVLFEEVDGGGLFVNRYTGRFTTIRFADKTETIRGGMLCQTMGLGKTVEQIAVVLSNPAPEEWLNSGYFVRRATTLVVCPQSLLGQWQQEVCRHAPSLRVGIVFSQSDFEILDDAALDIVLTSYETIRQQHVYQTANENRRTSRRGRSSVHPVPFLQTEWWRVILDEAQKITGESAVTKATQCLKANNRWVVSGTPICRRLQDLSGLLRFFGHNLGHRFYFESLGLGGEKLRDVLSVLMYRHGKRAVENELTIPPLTLETVYVQLSDIEHIKYSKMIRKCNAIKNVSRMKEETRTARLCRLLLLLRKICCCPFLVDGRKGDTVQASEALPIIEIKKRICREADLEVDVASRVNVKCITQLATALAVASKDYERAEQLISSALSISENALLPFLSNEGDHDQRSGTRLEHAKTLSGRAVILECLGRVEEARDMFADCFASVDKLLTVQLEKLQETRSCIPENGDLSEMGLQDFFADCSTRFSLAIFKLMMGKEPSDAISELRNLDCCISSYLAAFDDDIAAAVGESSHVLACLRGRLEIELKVSLHRRSLFRDIIALRISVLDCLVDLATLSVIENGDDHIRERNACRTLLDSLPMDRDRAEVGFIAECSSDEDVQDEDNFRSTALGENRTGLRLDSETIDYLVLQGSIMTGLLRTAEKLHVESDDSTLSRVTSRISLISIVVGKEPASVSSRCSSWISAMFAVLRTWLYLRQMITNCDENDSVAGRCWERCFVIREELRNLYRRSFDQLETFFEDIRSGNQDAFSAVTDLRRAEIELDRSEHELNSRQNELRYISQKFAEDVERDGDRIHSDDNICPICRSELHTPIVTPCGHIFCSPCLASYMVSGHDGLCPLRCHNRFQFKDCLLIDESTPEQRHKRFKGEKSVDEIQTDYGAKISDLLRRLFEIRRENPAAKSLIFSQWTDLLNVCRMALEEHGIRCVQLKGDCRQKANCIDLFLNSSTMTVFLIPMAQGASGLTMVAARYAFIMEPCLNPNLEDQATNRIHRIGQKYTTKVIKYIAKGTVEEPIAEIQDRLRATGYQAQKAYTPEVFDESILNDIFQ